MYVQVSDWAIIIYSKENDYSKVELNLNIQGRLYITVTCTGSEHF